MQKSESITNIAKALILFHGKVGKIRKDSKNPFFKNTYASLANILESTNDPLNESGLTITQFPIGENGLTTILIHAESGEFMQAEYHMVPVKDDPQGRGSALTYMRRYALSAILALVIDSDDDGNEASGIVNGKEAETHSNGTSVLPWLNEGTKQFEGAVKKLKAGTTTVDKIKTVMKVSKATETKLLELSKN